MGAAEPEGLGEEAAHDCRRALVADGELSVHGAGLLPRHRWRRRDHRHPAERAKALKKPPAYVLGCGHSVTHANITSMPDLTVTGALASGKAAYAMAGLGPADIDAVELYDAFTINTILFLEDLGFCKKGEGGAFASGGRIAPGGNLAVNTNGGGLSYCHPGMYGLLLLIEAVRQLRGECGARQVKDCEVALAHGNGGVLSSQATIILGTEATL